MSWKYSDPNEWEKAITSEVFPLEDVAAAYIEWEKEDIYDTTCACWEEKC